MTLLLHTAQTTSFAGRQRRDGGRQNGNCGRCGRWITVIVLALGLLSSCQWPWDDAPDNAPPRVPAQTFSSVEDAPLWGKVVVSDPEDSLTFAVVAGPIHGSLASFNSKTGEFLYEGTPNFNGEDAFSIRVEDSAGQAVVGTVRLTIGAVDDDPLAVNDVFAVSSANELAVLANDSDPDGHGLVKVELVGKPFVGSASVGANNTVSIQLPTGFKGVTKFRYRVTNASGHASDADAVVFVGIEPFKVVSLSAEGVLVNDLLTTISVSTPESHPVPQIASMRVAASGRALAYYSKERNGSAYRLMHVNLDKPGVASPVGPSAADVRGYQINADGRYVAFQTVEFQNGVSVSLFLYDAQSTAGPTLIAQYFGLSPDIPDLHPQFDAAGSALYFLGTTPFKSERCSVHRMNLATAIAVRVTPVQDCAAVSGFTVSLDGSKIVTRWLSKGAGAWIFANASLYDPNQPDQETRFTGEGRANWVEPFPVMSPDGAYAFLGYGVDSSSPAMLLQIVHTPSPNNHTVTSLSPEACCPPSFQHLRNAQVRGLNAAQMMRGDSRAMLLATGGGPGTQNLYEVPLDDAAASRMINAPVRGNELITDGRYNRQTDRMFYVRQVAQTSMRALEMTRRDAIGTSTQVTAAGDQLVSYQLDSQGRVALLVRSGVPDGPHAFVNVDAPQVCLPLQGPGVAVAGSAVMVPR